MAASTLYHPELRQSPPNVSNRQRHQQPALYVRCSPHKACDATQIAHNHIAASTEAVQSQYTCRHRWFLWLCRYFDLRLHQWNSSVRAIRKHRSDSAQDIRQRISGTNRSGSTSIFQKRVGRIWKIKSHHPNNLRTQRYALKRFAICLACPEAPFTGK